MRLGIIGGGAAGICAIKNGIAAGCEVIAFEQADQIGGTWVFSSETGQNKYGLDVHTSMYKGLHTNLPKEIMGYPDFDYPEQQKSYLPAEEVLDFFNSYADKFNVRECIKFEHHVLRVRPMIDDSWEVIVKNLPADKYETYIFDAILVCNGHYHTPALPKFKGADIFKGKQIHSHEYRSNEPFQGEFILLIDHKILSFNYALNR